MLSNLAIGDLDDYPDPRVVIFGDVSSGKSTITKALLGCDTSSNTNSCLCKDKCSWTPNFATGNWMGGEKTFSVSIKQE